eukprot:TRINITY_DN24845_c0_g1_i1.p1 TRINITY_DN24845_c0_g1~~TRINITY_DN24845_c0_g1_i1.p1  ORF type:complete len:351 (-),score=31.96 TRINITY_DN24845_c0_g1_i1:148-1200(-)
MGALRRGAVLVILLGVGIHTCGPGLISNVFIWLHTSNSDQSRFHPKLGPNVNGNLVRGIDPVPCFVTDDRLDWLERDFKHRDNDVWVTTYPKVGTTWTQMMVALLAGHKPTGIVDLFEACPWPEVDVGLLSTSRDTLRASAGADGPPRCFKSHWWNKGHMDIDKLPARSKVIFVFRDAESVFNSLFHHILNLYGFYQVTHADFPDGKAWDTLFNMFVAGELDFGDYFEHVAGWWKVRDRPNVLTLRFEDLKLHHSDAIRNISRFMGVEANESVVEYVRHQTSFDEMKKLEGSDAMKQILTWAGLFRGSHIRSGGGKDKVRFTLDQRARLRQRYEDVLAPLEMPRSWILKE